MAAMPQFNTLQPCLFTTPCRGEILYGSSMWSSGHRGGFDADGFDDYSAGVLGISASEEAEGEAVRRAAVSGVRASAC